MKKLAKGRVTRRAILRRLPEGIAETFGLIDVTNVDGAAAPADKVIRRYKDKSGQTILEVGADGAISKKLQQRMEPVKVRNGWAKRNV